MQHRPIAYPPLAGALLRGLAVAALLFPGPALSAAPARPVETRLAEGGRALLPIVIGATAGDRVKGAAQSLAGLLERMSGARFEITAGDGRTGLAVGLPADFPLLKLEDQFRPKESTRREEYLLRSHGGGVLLCGATEMAVEHAAWDLLYRLGYRQFFPGKTWEVVPRADRLAIVVDVREAPAYLARRIWYGFGPWDHSADAYAEWCRRNRATSGLELNSGHSYGGIVSRNRAEFAAHPEYYALVDGQRNTRGEAMFCVANPGLRQLVADDAIRFFEQNPDADSVSRDPSDGGGWCQCPECAAIGSVSDRALALANLTAEAVNKRFVEKYVGIYAYNEHSPPPGIRVHPRVVISVATAFIRGGYTVDQLIAGWQKQGASLGIREYYSVNTWDRDLPGRARGGDLKYLRETIPAFHARGARFLSAESSDNWGPNGLGYYLAARMLWDVGEAKRVDALVDDFLQKAFGPAREPMARFYRMLDTGTRPLLSDDLVGRMYRCLDEARREAGDPDIRARIYDLILYTRYVELFRAYSDAAGPERQKAFEALIRHAYRMRKTMMVHVKALYRDVAGRDRAVAIPEEAAWNKPEPANPWKSSAPFTEEELSAFLAAGIANNPLLEFETVAFTTNLTPAASLWPSPAAPAGPASVQTRGTHTFYTWVAQPPATLSLRVTGGLIAHYRDRGNVKILLFPLAEEFGNAVAQAEVPPDGKEYPVALKTPYAGLHRIQISDGSDMTRTAWEEGMPFVVPASTEAPAALQTRWSLYFYVPAGTKVVGGFAGGAGDLLDGDGKKVHAFPAKPGYFSVPVGEGQAGKLWRFSNTSGTRILMTVPPYLARSPQEILLPADVR